MKTYSSTSINRFDNNCPAAFGFMEDGTPYDRDWYNPGIAAHAVLQVIGQKSITTPMGQSIIADAVVQELITKGREYNQVHEPPMSPSAAFEGRDLALNWLKWNELSEGSFFEIGLGMTANGEPCDYYSEYCRFRALIDVVAFETIGDDDFAIDAVVVQDYKSAWPTGAGELETLQRKGQAVLVHKHFPDYLAVKMVATNLRTGMSFDRVVMLDHVGVELMAQWEKDILQACDAADITREARPGAGCLTCPYTLSCSDCLDCYKGNGADSATTLATLEAIRKKLIDVLKPKCVDYKFPVHNGFVGFKTMTKKVVTPDAHNHLVDHFYMNDPDQHIEEKSLLAGCSLTTSSVEQLIKTIYPDKKDIARDELLDLCIGTITESRFGVHKS